MLAIAEWFHVKKIFDYFYGMLVIHLQNLIDFRDSLFLSLTIKSLKICQLMVFVKALFCHVTKRKGFKRCSVQFNLCMYLFHLQSIIKS